MRPKFAEYPGVPGLDSFDEFMKMVSKQESSRNHKNILGWSSQWTLSHQMLMRKKTTSKHVAIASRDIWAMLSPKAKRASTDQMSSFTPSWICFHQKIPSTPFISRHHLKTLEMNELFFFIYVLESVNRSELSLKKLRNSKNSIRPKCPKPLNNWLINLIIFTCLKN